MEKATGGLKMDKMKELFEKMVNITYQAQAQGEIGMVTGDRIDKVVKEYEEYCNQEERKKLVSEAKDELGTVYKELSENNLESVFNKINKVDEYLDEIKKYNTNSQEGVGDINAKQKESMSSGSYKNSLMG